MQIIGAGGHCYASEISWVKPSSRFMLIQSKNVSIGTAYSLLPVFLCLLSLYVWALLICFVSFTVEYDYLNTGVSQSKKVWYQSIRTMVKLKLALILKQWHLGVKSFINKNNNEYENAIVLQIHRNKSRKTGFHIACSNCNRHVGMYRNKENKECTCSSQDIHRT